MCINFFDREILCGSHPFPSPRFICIPSAPDNESRRKTGGGLTGISRRIMKLLSILYLVGRRRRNN